MGSERFLLASTINLIVAQRLVRKICENCREPVELASDVIRRMQVGREQIAGATFYRGKGCPLCGNTGYHGRLPIFEFLVVDGDIGERIIAGQSEAQIKEAVRNKGYGNLLDSGVQAAVRGLTTAEEVIRVASMGES